MGLLTPLPKFCLAPLVPRALNLQGILLACPGRHVHRAVGSLTPSVSRCLLGILNEDPVDCCTYVSLIKGGMCADVLGLLTLSC